MKSFDLNGKTIIADKGYDSRKLIKYIEERGGRALIPSRKNAHVRRKVDIYEYAERHLVEKLFLKMKNRRRLATRYDKLASSFLAVTLLAAILICTT